MIDAAQTVLDLIADAAPEVIEADTVRRRAVLWNYTVLGEAANQLPSDFKAAHAGIQWLEVGRLRNRLVQIQAWADEAEVGYDVDELRRRGPRSARSPQEIEEQP